MYNLHEFSFDISYFLITNYCYKLLTESFILAFRLMYCAGRCCKHWQCDILLHHCCGMWPALQGDCDGVLVSVLRARM